MSSTSHAEDVGDFLFLPSDSFIHAGSINFFADEFINAPCPSVLLPIVLDGSVVSFGCEQLLNVLLYFNSSLFLITFISQHAM